MQSTIPVTGYIQVLKGIQFSKFSLKLWKERTLNNWHDTYVLQCKTSPTMYKHTFVMRVRCTWVVWTELHMTVFIITDPLMRTVSIANIIISFSFRYQQAYLYIWKKYRMWIKSNNTDSSMHEYFQIVVTLIPNKCVNYVTSIYKINKSSKKQKTS